MFVPRLASDLECPDEIRQRARALAEQAADVANASQATVRAHRDTLEEQVA
jgi:transcription initiation factor TFIIB